MAVDKNDRIVEFQEKPKVPKSNLASMGIYVFTWKTLRSYLKEDEKSETSDHDFGKDIIPTMLGDGKKLQAYRFQGYWKDVGTLASLHQANMDIALDNRELNLFDDDDTTKIYSEDTHSVPQYVGTKGSIKRSIANQGAIILGSVDSCVISNEVIIEEGAVCTRCVIMAGARIKKGAKVHNAIVAPEAIVGENQEINLGKADVILVSGGSYK
jgi:glucose-1-phosphate adenylyltransferase